MNLLLTGIWNYIYTILGTYHFDSASNRNEYQETSWG
jgi:hypothetical protein